MISITGRALHFSCCLTSPFHTTRQEYANLIKCAPFILGSTLRGALLSHLITTRCDDATIKSGAYESQDIFAPFFAHPPRIYFSFGRFPENVEEKMESHARITLERESGSVAEGALMSIEAVAAGNPFEFEVLLFDNSPDLTQAIEKGVQEMAGTMGLGGLRSIGLGQFVVEDVNSHELSDYVANIQQAQRSALSSRSQVLRLDFTTPYILADGRSTWQGDSTELSRKLEQELTTTLQATDVTAKPPTIERVDIALRPDFVGRWSYERGVQEHRFVAWPGSSLTLHLSDAGDLETVLTMASAFGLGEWAEWGFGRFEYSISDDLVSE